MDKERYLKVLIGALQDCKGVSLAFRPRGIKFDESKAVLRLDLVNHNRLKVGDRVKIISSWPTGCQDAEEEKVMLKWYNQLAGGGVVLGFFELTGKVGKTTVKEIFCALSHSKDLTSVIPPKMHNDHIPIFWVDGLEEIYNTNLDE